MDRKMVRKVVTSKPVNPSAWLLLRQKILRRNAIIHAMREEGNAKHNRDTKRMELERFSNAIYNYSPGFRHEAHTLRNGDVFKPTTTASPMWEISL